MTIGNLSSKIRQLPSTHTVIIVAILLIAIKNCNIPQNRLDKQQQTNREVLNVVLRQIHQSVTFKPNPNTESEYYNFLCADGHFRRCKPVLAAWLTDCPKYRDLYHLKRHVLYWCEYPKNELGDYVPPDRQHPRRDHNLCRTLRDANAKAANAELSSRHVHRGFNMFRHIPYILSDLPKPDVLHTMQIGILDHFQKWIFHFMKTYKPLDKYNTRWLSVPAYHDLTPENKSYEKVTQWYGKEMNEMSQYLLEVVTLYMRGRSPAQRPWFNCTIAYPRVLLEFCMYARINLRMMQLWAIWRTRCIIFTL